MSGARGIDIAPNGDLLVISKGGTPQIKVVFEDASGTAQTVSLVSQAGLSHAIRYKDGYVYASTDTTIYRYEFDWHFFDPTSKKKNKKHN
jgi:hypothetical protein